MSTAEQTRSEATSARYAQHFTALKGELGGLGYFFKGTVLKRMMKCGQDRCACQHDPSKRHGPYFEWTYKAKGKTINKRLCPEEVPIYRAATQQYRKLKSLLARMEKLSRAALARLAKEDLQIPGAPAASSRTRFPGARSRKAKVG
jgi:hypothetical protein